MPFTLYLVFAKGLALQLNANDFKCAALTSIDITLESIPTNEKKLFFSSDEYSFALVILQSPHTSSQIREAFSVSLLCTRSSCFHLNSENYKFFFPLLLGVFFTLQPNVRRFSDLQTLSVQTIWFARTNNRNQGNHWRMHDVARVEKKSFKPALDTSHRTRLAMSCLFICCASLFMLCSFALRAGLEGFHGKWHSIMLYWFFKHLNLIYLAQQVVDVFASSLSRGGCLCCELLIEFSVRERFGISHAVCSPWRLHTWATAQSN